MARNPLEAPPGYGAFLRELQERIRGARLRAALAVNQELVTLYWSTGAAILARQRSEGWGAKVIDRLADDLRRAFPEMTGLSARNLKYIGHSPRPTPTSASCNRSLHDCRGVTTSDSSRP
jgi:uncharacterized protein DUF1016